MDNVAAHRTLSDITIGETADFERTISESDVSAFAHLSGDFNPLHVDSAYAQKTKFGRRLVHGMLLGSLCSRMVGMYVPGEKCLYLRQTLTFKKPVHIGDTVKVLGRVASKSVSTKIIEVEISMLRDGEEVVSGVATV